MQKSKITWATTVHYEKVFKHLDDKGLDTQNEYYYKMLLEPKGVTVFNKDLKGWLKALTTDLDIKGFEL